MDDRTFDLVLLSNWEDQIIYDPDYDSEKPLYQPKEVVTAPINHALEDGSWMQSIIWDAKTPFRDFTQIEIDDGDESTEDKFAGTGYDIFTELGTKDRDRSAAAKEDAP